MKIFRGSFPLFLLKPELGHTSPKPAPDDTSEQITSQSSYVKGTRSLEKKYSEMASEQNSLCRDNRALPLLILLRWYGRVIIHLQEWKLEADEAVTEQTQLV